jgi:uncharacterized protein YraI
MVRSLTLTGAVLLGLMLPTMAEAATASTYLNIRSGPGMAHPVIYIAWPGWPMTVHSCDQYWCSVTYKWVSGWASARYISEQ